MPEKDYLGVARPCEEYEAMLPDWDMVDALYGGTRKMREAGGAYLPKFEAESPLDYKVRLNQAVLFNMYAKACEGLAGKAFKKPIVLQDDVPDDIREWAENIDRENRNINVFAKDLFLDAVRRGVSHFMVDFPRSTALTREEQRRNGERPYWIHMPAREIIGWREAVVNGQRILTQLRRYHTIKVPNGEWDTTQVERVTVYWLENPEAGDRATAYYQVYERKQVNNNGRLELVWMPAVDQAGNELAGPLGISYIPLVSLYTNRTGFMQARPPLMDLAYKNVEHWQSSSDQRHILKWARFAIPVAIGWTEDQDSLLFGPSSVVKITNPDGDFKFAEHSGGAIGVGFQDLETLKEEMAYLALDPMLRKPGNVTATARALDEASSNSQLETWMDELKNAIETGLQYSAERTGETAGGSIQVNEDFAIPVADNDAQVVIEAYRDKLIPRKVALETLQRVMPVLGDTLENYDIEDVIAMINSEARSNPAFDSLRRTLEPGE
jgi:hypothetical protein